jgi:hypothetical protein
MPIKVPAGERKSPLPILPVVPINEKTARTVREFCVRNNVSVSMFYKLKRDGKAPRLIYIGTKPLITDAAERAWLRDLEAAQPTNNAA